PKPGPHQGSSLEDLWAGGADPPPELRQPDPADAAQGRGRRDRGPHLHLDLDLARVDLFLDRRRRHLLRPARGQGRPRHRADRLRVRLASGARSFRKIARSRRSGCRCGLARRGELRDLAPLHGPGVRPRLADALSAGAPAHAYAVASVALSSGVYVMSLRETNRVPLSAHGYATATCRIELSELDRRFTDGYLGQCRLGYGRVRDHRRSE